MPNMKALSHRLKKLWPMLKFFKSRSKVTVKVTCSKFMVSLERSCHNMKALTLTIKKLWPMLKFFKSRSKVTVKVTSSKLMVPLERSCHKDHTCQI